MTHGRDGTGLEAVRAVRTSVLVATSLADGGLDIPRLSRVVLAFPAKAAGRIEQRIGRIMRPHGDKDAAAILDIVDPRVGVLRYHSCKERGTIYGT